MCYYDSWFEENWCEEPREEEMALIEAIKENVKKDIKQEMERLRKENEELQQRKRTHSLTMKCIRPVIIPCTWLFTIA